jgi:hypothetical protein
MVLHVACELEAVQTARHIDVREHHPNVGSLFQGEDGVVCCGRLDDLETSLFENIDREEPDQRLILDDENDRRRCARRVYVRILSAALAR